GCRLCHRRRQYLPDRHQLSGPGSELHDQRQLHSGGHRDAATATVNTADDATKGATKEFILRLHRKLPSAPLRGPRRFRNPKIGQQLGAQPTPRFRVMIEAMIQAMIQAMIDPLPPFTFVYAALGPLSAVGVLFYLASGKAEFHVTADPTGLARRKAT